MADLFGTAGGLWAGKENREFAEEMASTQYQRAVADMKAAGLNPMAVFGSGGGTPAAAPGGQMENPVVGGSLGSSAKGVIEAAQGLAQTKKTKSEDELVKAQADMAKSNARAAATTADVVSAENEAYKRAMTSSAGQAAAVGKKYGGSGPVGMLGAAGAAAGSLGVFGGHSSAKRAGEWWTGTGHTGYGPAMVEHWMSKQNEAMTRK